MLPIRMWMFPMESNSSECSIAVCRMDYNHSAGSGIEHIVLWYALRIWRRVKTNYRHLHRQPSRVYNELGTFASVEATKRTQSTRSCAQTRQTESFVGLVDALSTLVSVCRLFVNSPPFVAISIIYIITIVQTQIPTGSLSHAPHNTHTQCYAKPAPESHCRHASRCYCGRESRSTLTWLLPNHLPPPQSSRLRRCRFRSGVRHKKTETQIDGTAGEFRAAHVSLVCQIMC